MANTHRGEIDVTLDGKRYRMCLTLGALAELEDAFGDEDMLALATRFESGRLRSQDAIRIIGGGLRGCGHEIDDGAVACMTSADGAAGYIAIVARLLEVTFGGGAGDSDSDGGNSNSRTPMNSNQDARPEVRGPAPFPGTT